MTKRRCPFDDMTPQMKYRVGEEHLEVTKEKFIKHIYSKTLDRLFDAQKAKKLECDVKARLQIKPVTCRCEKEELKKNRACWFCDKFVCVNCMFLCLDCNKFFCEGCTTKVYGKVETATLCLSCASHSSSGK